MVLKMWSLGQWLCGEVTSRELIRTGNSVTQLLRVWTQPGTHGIKHSISRVADSANDFIANGLRVINRLRFLYKLFDKLLSYWIVWEIA